MTTNSFNFPKGYPLAEGKYEIIKKVGGGWESEVYLVKEMMTGIERAAKFFYPKRNVNNKTLKFYAKKLHKLRHCSVVIRYLTQEMIIQEGVKIFYLISDFVEGQTLSDFLNDQKGKRLTDFQGIHLLHSLALGIQEIHNLNEYHGDLHTDNIMVERHGLSFDLKILDMFHWDAPRRENIQDDVVNMVRVFYDSIGGAKMYPKHPQAVKDICCGLKKSLILSKFKTAGQLRNYLETMEWY